MTIDNHDEPTAQMVRAFSRYMFDYYNLKVVNKNDSSFMKLLGWFLDTIGVMDKQTFMKKASTTIGNKVYMPFTIGEDPDNWPLSLQMSIITHECQHKEQMRKDGKSFYFRYLFRSAKRAAYEADAYRCNLELFHWYTGKILNIDAIAESIKNNYGCTSSNAGMAKVILERAALHIEEGLIVSKATKYALEWIRDNAFDYKGKGNKNIVSKRFL